MDSVNNLDLMWDGDEDHPLDDVFMVGSEPSSPDVPKPSVSSSSNLVPYPVVPPLLRENAVGSLITAGSTTSSSSDVVGSIENVAGVVPNIKFRINCRNVFLTWPRCGGYPLGELMEFLKGRFRSWSPHYIIVCQESHQDGSPHYHAVVCCSSKVNITSAGRLDFMGSHGDYRPVINVVSAVEYLKKGGNIS